jgi:TfoX/Sxy family transcriptional regulator of competence genes
MPKKKQPKKQGAKRGGRAMPSFSKAPAEVIAAFEAARARVDAFETRTMFGYPAAFVGGNMFACVFQDRIMVRLSPEDRTTALAIQGAKLFEPMPGRPMREYVDLPTNVRHDPAALGGWLARGRAYAASLPKKAAKKPLKRRSR